MSDLVVTNTDPFSHNFSVGYMIGQCRKDDNILKELCSVIEGTKHQKYCIAPKKVLNKFMNRKLKKKKKYQLK